MNGETAGLYDPENERDSCGVGMAIRIDGVRDHRTVEYGLTVLENMAHRGAENADGLSGDGAGITVQVPHTFVRKLKIPVPEAGRYGTGIIFLPKDEGRSDVCLGILREEILRYGLTEVAIRDVPVDHDSPGPLAKRTEPRMVQIFISSFDEQDVLERKLYSARMRAGNRIVDPDFYICSLSTRCITYKGMLTPRQLREYFLDLSDPDFTSAIAMVHSRFSTNTLPMWKLAQPFRMLCHNGEINTIRGNRSWMGARESLLASDSLPDVDALFPIIQSGMSDSASLDNVFEFLTMAGRTMPGALSVMIPESWNNRNPIPDSLKAYYEYHSILMEPWDGPAAVLFTDGRYAGGMLDRNGLRPARYTLTKDGLLIMASELGTVDIPDGEIAESGRLMPGKMMMADTATGRILRDMEIKGGLASAFPYRDWLDRNRVDLDEVSSGRDVGRSVPDMIVKTAEFGYDREDAEKVIIPMAIHGKEEVGSTGFDAPLAILSDRPQRLFSYFRQSFAQVTNPPIDPIREELVMSLTGYIGSVHNNILDTVPKLCRIIKVRHPIITNRELDLLENMRYRGFNTAVIPMAFDGDQLKEALEHICSEAERAVDAGGSYIVLTDRNLGPDDVPIPSVLATSAVHQHLLRVKKRVQTGIIVESGEPREAMHFALLFGYGANAVNPYMAFALIERFISEGRITMDPETAERNYVRAAEKGLLKIMSKMGIATIRSYRGSRLFEAVGIDGGVMSDYFGGTTSSIGGIGLDEIACEAKAAHDRARSGSADTIAEASGTYESRKGGERHAWDPASVRALHTAVRGNDAAAYDSFAKGEDNGLFFVRDLMEIRGGKAVLINEVEPAESIMRRFVGEGISFGAIGREAHETIAEAMNSIGATSNTGEGGEDPSRAVIGLDGRNLRSAVKQVASGRFGVTTQYLVSADELQIKIAQGAKPGEGGQLLGFKVDADIATTRHTIPGITLISPPPHHDIYSIEDLKQLIFDLKCANPKARISVKLVSEAGVGTVAAGVVKAGADVILISGADGGTGASPLSSMRYAGLPWEIGLAEAQQTLAMDGLRGKVTLQSDGQLKTGRDVIISALLGAEEYGFATALMVSMGCIMCRKCQTNACPAGIATQDPERRAKFTGKPEAIVNYLRFVAEDTRRHLAAMGFRSLDEIIGRSDLLTRKVGLTGKASKADISRMTVVIPGDRIRLSGQNDMTAGILDRRIIAESASALENGISVKLHYHISNTDRSVGTMLAGEMERSGRNFQDGTISVGFEGTAGQSFGSFLIKGISFSLKGQANDYVGKGLSGGKISIYRGSQGLRCNVIAGNTCLYGATSGEVYIAGRVGERFCVRNSGAVAVAEGVGDHCCEYMTGGRVVILGGCGRNFAAGMSAGVAYVLDDSGDFDRHCNMDMVELSLVESDEDISELRHIIEDHYHYTGSLLAGEILSNWESEIERFIKVMPIGYKKLLQMSHPRGV